MVRKAPEGPSTTQLKEKGGRISILKKNRDIPLEEIEGIEKVEKARREFLLTAANKSYLEAQYISKILHHILKLEEEGKVPDFSSSTAHHRPVEALSRRSKGHDTKIHDKSVERLAVRLVGKLEEYFGRLHDFTPDETTDEIDNATSELYERLLEFETPVDEIRRSQRAAAFSQEKQETMLIIPNEKQKTLTKENIQSTEDFKHFMHDHEQKAVVEARCVAKIVALLDLAAEKGLYVALQGQKEFREIQSILESRAKHYRGEGRGALDELVALLHEIRRFVQIEPKKLAEDVQLDIEWLDELESK